MNLPDKDTLVIGIMSNGTLMLTGQERIGILNVKETEELLNYIKDLASVVDDLRGEVTEVPEDFDDDFDDGEDDD